MGVIPFTGCRFGSRWNSISSKQMLFLSCSRLQWRHWAIGLFASGLVHLFASARCQRFTGSDSYVNCQNSLIAITLEEFLILDTDVGVSDEI